MYYDNKLIFYIKQYSTQIVVGIICLLIVISGLSVYYKLNDNAQEETVVSGSAELNVETSTDVSVTEDDSILSDSLRALQAGEKTTVRIATIDDTGTLVVIAGDTRFNAKLIGVSFTDIEPDTVYSIDEALCGNYVDIAFDESKVSNGYAMIYVYTDEDTLYNAQILKQGKAKLDSTISKKALEYDRLAESQAYAKQTLAGVWGE